MYVYTVGSSFPQAIEAFMGLTDHLRVECLTGVNLVEMASHGKQNIKRGHLRSLIPRCPAANVWRGRRSVFLHELRSACGVSRAAHDGRRGCIAIYFVYRFLDALKCC